MQVPYRTFMTLDDNERVLRVFDDNIPGEEWEPGVESFSEGFHLLALSVFVLRSGSIAVASSAISLHKWRLRPSNTVLVAKPMSASHVNGAKRSY